MKLKLVYVFLLYLSTLSTGLWAENLDNKNINIPFSLVRGLILIEVEVNSEIGNFIFDTGSNVIFINKEQKGEKRYELSSLTGSIISYETEIEKLEVGNIRKENVEAYIADLNEIESYVDMEVAGILGCNFFVPNSVIIDYESGKLRISQERIDGKNMWQFNSIDFEFASGVPVTKCRIGSEVYLFALDSGASSHFLDIGICYQYQEKFKKTGEVVEIITAGNQKHITEKVIMDALDIGDIQLKNKVFCPKDFYDLNNSTHHKISGILSLSKLSSRFIVMDLKENKLYF